MQLEQSAKALADASRIRILAALRHGELAVGEIVEALNLGQSRVSRHLHILAEGGLTHSRRDGRWVFYSLPPTGTARAFIDAALGLAGDDPEIQGDDQAVQAVLAERARETSRFFDSVAAKWQTMRDESLGGFDLPAKIAEIMPQVQTCADLGCGSGETLAAMSGKAQNLIGVDNSAKMLEAARELLGDAASLRIGDLAHLPLAEAETDFVSMSLVLHHLPDPAGAVREALRVLKSGGTIVIADFDAHGREEMRTRFGDRRLGFEPHEIPKWLAMAGFSDIEREALDLTSGLTVSLYVAIKP
jgi:ArsR family transcriptional regulator